jgi:hypothetical protein
VAPPFDEAAIMDRSYKAVVESQAKEGRAGDRKAKWIWFTNESTMRRSGTIA